MMDPILRIRTTRPLTDEEREAVEWARSNSRRWRKEHAETREESIATRPCDQSEESWGRIYDRPFGIPAWNAMTAIVRRLVQGGVLP